MLEIGRCCPDDPPGSDRRPSQESEGYRVHGSRSGGTERSKKVDLFLSRGFFAPPVTIDSPLPLLSCLRCGLEAMTPSLGLVESRLSQSVARAGIKWSAPESDCTRDRSIGETRSVGRNTFGFSAEVVQEQNQRRSRAGQGRATVQMRGVACDSSFSCSPKTPQEDDEGQFHLALVLTRGKGCRGCKMTGAHQIT